MKFDRRFNFLEEKIKRISVKNFLDKMSGFKISVEKKNFSMNIVTLHFTIEYLLLEDFNMNILTLLNKNMAQLAAASKDKKTG